MAKVQKRDGHITIVKKGQFSFFLTASKYMLQYVSFKKEKHAIKIFFVCKCYFTPHGYPVVKAQNL